MGAGSFSPLLVSSCPVYGDTRGDKSSLSDKLGAGAPMDMSEGGLGGGGGGNIFP